MQIASFLLTLCLSTVAFVAARVGGKAHRRRLQHRKLFWAKDELAVEEQFVIVFEDNDTDEEVQDFISQWMARDETEVLGAYDSALKGAVIKIGSIKSLIEILDDSRVAFIQEVRRCWQAQCLLSPLMLWLKLILFWTGFCVCRSSR